MDLTMRHFDILSRIFFAGELLQFDLVMFSKDYATTDILVPTECTDSKDIVNI